MFKVDLVKLIVDGLNHEQKLELIDAIWANLPSTFQSMFVKRHSLISFYDRQMGQ